MFVYINGKGIVLHVVQSDMVGKSKPYWNVRN